jgi:hypothetical protein
MSSFDQDRKVSKPTEADFAHGFASSYGVGHRGGKGVLLGLAIGFLFGKAGRR